MLPSHIHIDSHFPSPPNARLPPHSPYSFLSFSTASSSTTLHFALCISAPLTWDSANSQLLSPCFSHGRARHFFHRFSASPKRPSTRSLLLASPHSLLVCFCYCFFRVVSLRSPFHSFISSRSSPLTRSCFTRIRLPSRPSRPVFKQRCTRLPPSFFIFNFDHHITIASHLYIVNYIDPLETIRYAHIHT